MKTCSRCRRSLPRSAFYKNSGAPDGLANICKDCKRQLARVATYQPSPRRINYIVGLRFSPLEHIIEGLNCRELGAAMGCGHNVAAQLAAQFKGQRRGGKDVDCWCPDTVTLDDAADQKIRKWLEDLCPPAPRR